MVEFMKLRIVKKYLGCFKYNYSSNCSMSETHKIYVWVNSKEEGYEPLMLMIKKEHIGIVELFIEKEKFLQIYGNVAYRFVDKAEKLKEKYEKNFQTDVKSSVKT